MFTIFYTVYFSCFYYFISHQLHLQTAYIGLRSAVIIVATRLYDVREKLSFLLDSVSCELILRIILRISWRKEH